MRPAFSLLAFAALCLAGSPSPGLAAQSADEQPQAGAPRPAHWPSELYEPLIGEWGVGPSADDIAMIMRFEWAANRAYIEFSAGMIEGDEVVPHFAGILVWNGVSGTLDMLVSLDPEGGLAEERGTLSRQPDGSFLREITGYFAARRDPSSGREIAASSAEFRQTFRPTGPGRMTTSVLRRTADGGWTPTFPGSDDLQMVRRGGR